MIPLIKVQNIEQRNYWKMLFRKMGVGDPDLDQIIVKHENNLRKQIFEALCIWAELNHFHVGVEDLSKALERNGKRRLAEELRNKYSTRY